MSVFLAFGLRRARFWVMLTETPLAACVLLTSALSLTPAIANAGAFGRLAMALQRASSGALLGLGAIALVVVAFERRAESDA
jgi:hypothetical protein